MEERERKNGRTWLVQSLLKADPLFVSYVVSKQENIAGNMRTASFRLGGTRNGKIWVTTSITA
jgi:hypothetical protein